MTLDFPALLETLDHDPAEHVSLCRQVKGGTFTTSVVTVAEAARTRPDDHADMWFSVNPVEGPPRTAAGRGTVEQVVRLAALYADLDAKDGGLRDFDTAQKVINVLSDLLGSRPSAVTLSGNGLQPFWPIDGRVSGLDAVALLRRFGRLVRHVAALHDGKVDSVYDLSRVLRVPGSFNHKGDPKPVLTLGDSGHPLTVAEINEALLAYGVPENADDREQLGTVVSAPSEWAWAPRTCAYTAAMVKSWETNNPTARHPWLVSQATRLACARRLGCVTESDHNLAIEALATRFRSLLSSGEIRKEQVGEIGEALSWGVQRAAAKTADGARSELGTHQHTDTLVDAPIPWRPTLIQGTSALAPDAEPAPVPSSPTTLERSEDGHAQQLIDAYGDLIRYCPERGSWLTWNGSRWAWQPKGGGTVREYAKNVARAFPTGDQAALSHKRRCLSSQGIGGCLRQAETDSRVIVGMNDLDSDPFSLNTPAGLVDLRTGKISAPNPGTLCTKTTAVAPIDEPDPTWDAFLDDTFGTNHELRSYVQRLVGVTLIGEVREQLLGFLHGMGANGKSTMAEALMHALGVGETGYAIAAPAEMLMIRKHSEHPAELAQLAGARMVVCSELDDGQRFAEAKIKQLTGRDSINARFLYGQPFTFSPSHTFWLLGNHRPQARTGGMAFWRRVKLIEFAHVVPPEKRDPALGDKLNAAGGAVLAWGIAGAVDYLVHGIREPEFVSAATRAYAEDQDTVARFVEDRVHLAPGIDVARAAISDLRNAYESWCHEIGEEPVSARRLTQELHDRWAIQTVKGAKGRRFYTGVTLLADDGEVPPEGAEEWYR